MPKKKRYRRSIPARADLIAALGLEAEGKTRGQKYDFSTKEFWERVKREDSPRAKRARKELGVE